MRGSARAVVVVGSAVLVAVLVGLLVWNPRGQADRDSARPLVFYCAAGIKPPVEEVVRNYEDEFGVAIRLQYGGSGTLLSNLRVAQEGDLYLAGDASFIDIAREQNLLAESMPLATMRPVIATAKGNPKNIRSAQDLVRDDVRVALGNPDAASVGKQTRIALTKAGLWDGLEEAVQSRGVFKPTVNDVANDIKIGTVDAGVVWDSTADQYPELEIAAPLTEDEGFTMQVTIGILRSSEVPTEALRFARYLSARDKGLKAFQRHHYAVVEGDAWAEEPEILLLSGGVNRPAIEETLRAFEQREGCKITRVYNGCGILVAQMKAGERPDAYFACDVSFMHQVGDLFNAPVNVSETDILIAVQPGNPRGIASLADLAGEGLKLGVANAEQSALGALTKRMLGDAGSLSDVMLNVRSQTPTADMLVNQLRAGGLDAVIVYEANIAQVREHLDIVRIDLPSAKAIQPFAVAQATPYK
ncbi:MAG: substrate-binding domain-containing protein [Planctomycetota bacterium]|jgi:molybdenum ABC transporter molybdate-binding protein